MFWLRPVALRVTVPKRRMDRPTWEVSVDGRVIGWLREHTIGRSSVVFYNATGIYTVTGQSVDLENSADFRERLERLIEFDQNPEAFRSTHLRAVLGRSQE